MPKAYARIVKERLDFANPYWWIVCNGKLYGILGYRDNPTCFHAQRLGWRGSNVLNADLEQVHLLQVIELIEAWAINPFR